MTENAAINPSKSVKRARKMPKWSEVSAKQGQRSGSLFNTTLSHTPAPMIGTLLSDMFKSIGTLT
jgi:hypothetical protein